MTAPSSQEPCICPEDGVWLDCPRRAFMADYVGQDPFKDHLRDGICVGCRNAVPWHERMVKVIDGRAVQPLCPLCFESGTAQ